MKNRLTLVKDLGMVASGKTKTRRGLYLCECGTEKVLKVSNVKNNYTRSCGCYMKEVARKMGQKGRPTHGRSSDSIYKLYYGIIQRCYNPKHKNYDSYGGRGIVMCNEWKESFETFLNDMGERPSKAHSIDRRKNNEGYSKDNCRWVTSTHQANNKRTNRFIIFYGIKKTIAQWEKIMEVKKGFFHARKHLGFSDVEILTVSKGAKRCKINI